MNANGTIEIKATFFSTSNKRVRCFPNIFKKREFKVQKESIESVGMSFDQLANGMFLNEHQELGNDLNKYSEYKQKNESDWIYEMCWFAHRSYLSHQNKVCKFDKGEFLLGLAKWLESKENATLLTECIKNSISFGVKKK